MHFSGNMTIEEEVSGARSPLGKLGGSMAARPLHDKRVIWVVKMLLDVVTFCYTCLEFVLLLCYTCVTMLLHYGYTCVTLVYAWVTLCLYSCATVMRLYVVVHSSYMRVYVFVFIFIWFWQSQITRLDLLGQHDGGLLGRREGITRQWQKKPCILYVTSVFVWTLCELAG